MDEGNGKNIEGNKVKEWDWDWDGFNEWVRDRKSETVRERERCRETSMQREDKREINIRFHSNNIKDSGIRICIF